MGFLANHPLKRVFVPVMKLGLPQTESSFSCAAGTAPGGGNFLLTPPGGKEAHTPRLFPVL